MKAKDYIADIEAARETGVDEHKILHTTLVKMMEDGKRRAMARTGGRTPHDGVMRPVLREMNATWMAVARAAGWNPQGWRLFWKERGVTW